MATILGALTKFAPGRVADIPAFSKAMSKLASYRQSHKYEKVLRQLIADGLISVDDVDKNETQVAKTEMTIPPPEVIVTPEESQATVDEVQVTPAQVEEESIKEPQATVDEVPLTLRSVTPIKKKR